MKISCVIIDDDPDALKLLEEYINAVPFLELQGQFFDALEAREFLRGVKTDVIITDINMPVISGMQFAKLMPKSQKFIFTTAHEEHAPNSFQFHVIDHLLKPVSFSRFIIAAEKIKMINPKDQRDTPEDTHMFVRSRGQVLRVNYDEILYIHGEKEYVGIHFQDKRILIYKRMKEMERLLPGNFKRVHLSFIINLNYLDMVSGNYVTIGEERIPIGLSYRHAFHEYLNSRLYGANR